MDYKTWIKMGFRLLKISLIVVLVGYLYYSNEVINKYSVLDNYSFSKSFGVSTVVVKDKEEKPKIPIVNSETNILGVNKYVGDLTGYVAHCPACYGTLACKPSYDVYKNGVVTYFDSSYGNVRIVASSKNLKCGSIIKFNLSTISSDPVYAIVLDRWVLGTDIDLLVATEQEAIVNVGRRKTTYEVLRYGW